MARSKGVTFESTHQFLNELFAQDVHAKRVYSLANATFGVIGSASLAVNTTGQGLALARGRLTKHTVSRVNAVVAGWVNYFRVGNSSRAFSEVRDYLEVKIRTVLTRRRRRRKTSIGRRLLLESNIVGGLIPKHVARRTDDCASLKRDRR